jgi:hypothetical protein
MSSAILSSTSSISRTAPATASKRELLNINSDTFRANIGRRPFTIAHRLTAHPLLTLPSLIELSKKLPAENVRYNRGDVPTSQRIYTAAKNGLSIEETIRQIENCGSWLVLRFVEQDPEYCALLDECLDEIQALSEPVMPGMCKREGFIFVTSPGSITPFHADPEYNFLMQIRGRKTASLFDVSDRSIVSEEVLEKYLAEGPFCGEFKDEYQQRAFAFDLNPGDGLHFPLNWPHWVRNGDEVSISLSITYRTPQSERTSIIYNVNHQLRKRGFNPTPYGKSALLDSTKFNAYRVTRRTMRLLGLTKVKGLDKY